MEKYREREEMRENEGVKELTNGIATFVPDRDQRQGRLGLGTRNLEQKRTI